MKSVQVTMADFAVGGGFEADSCAACFGAFMGYYLFEGADEVAAFGFLVDTGVGEAPDEIDEVLVCLDESWVFRLAEGTLSVSATADPSHRLDTRHAHDCLMAYFALSRVPGLSRHIITKSTDNLLDQVI